MSKSTKPKEPSVTIPELLTRIGAENITIQWLHKCTLDASVNLKNNEGRLKLVVGKDKARSVMSHMLGNRGPSVGLLVWIPLEKLEKVTKEIENENKNS